MAAGKDLVEIGEKLNFLEWLVEKAIGTGGESIEHDGIIGNAGHGDHFDARDLLFNPADEFVPLHPGQPEIDDGNGRFNWGDLFESRFGIRVWTGNDKTWILPEPRVDQSAEDVVILNQDNRQIADVRIHVISFDAAPVLGRA